MTTLRFAPIALAIGAIASTCSINASAEEDRLAFHGYGNQDFRKSSANSYLGADSRGTWDNNFLGLVFTGTINERSQIWAQLQANSTEQARVTWMFVDYQFNDSLRAHVGRVKFPYGIYNEYIDTKALQLTAVEPSAYSGPADMGYDAYNGVGLDYDLSLGTSGKLGIQGFYGNIYNPPPPTSAPIYANPIDAEIVPHNDRRIVGAKIGWETPVEGLRLLFSGNRASLESTVSQPTLGALFMENRWIGSVDLVRGEFDVKAEYNHHTVGGADGYSSVTSTAWYLQGGYGLGRWTPYARYEVLVTDQRKSADPSFYERTALVGTSYRLSRNLNLRGEVHFNHGYALPVVAGETPMGQGTLDWRMYAVSVNFMF